MRAVGVERLSVIAVAAALLAGRAAAGDKVELKLRLEAGDAWRFDSENVTRMTSEILVDGQRQRQFEQTVRQRRAGKAEVLAETGKLPTSMRIAFDRSCATVIEGGGQGPQTAPFAYAGRTVTLGKAADGRVDVLSDGNGSGNSGDDAQTLGELRSYI